MTAPAAGASPPSLARFRRDLLALVPPPAPSAPLGLAVSGGGDSVALLLLAQAAFPGAVAAATVDHALRAESADEARFVAELCGRLGVPHETLRLASPPAGASLQARAREARYAALAGWARTSGIPTIATAHHCDDQAETLLMRIARGSGLSGLAAIRAAAAMAGGEGVRVVRPLLGWRRAELRAIVAARGIVPVDDPANDAARFDRTHARRLLATAPWLDAERLAATTAHLAEAEEALEWAARDLWRRHAARGEDGAVSLAVADLPPELQRRLVRDALRLLGRDDPTGPKLARLLDALRKGKTATLAGVRCVGGEVWHLSPAAPRRGN